MVSEAFILAEILTSKRWELQQIVLSYDVPHKPGAGTLGIASARVDGDAVEIEFSCAERPTYRPRLRVWAPRGFRTFHDRQNAFEIQSAERIQWDERNIRVHDVRPLISIS